MEHFIDAIKRYADFSGRAQRKQYWMFVLFYVLIYIAFSIIDGLIGISLLTTIFALLMIIPSISVGVRRLHDTGRSGLWLLIGFIPIIGFIVLIIFFVQDSQGENEYGVSPKFT